jgi:hypothetical protein
MVNGLPGGGTEERRCGDSGGGRVITATSAGIAAGRSTRGMSIHSGPAPCV